MIYLVQTVSPTVCFLCSLSKEQKNGIKKKHERRSCRRLNKKHQARMENYLQKKSNKDYPDMDITDHAINKFILIFQTLLKTSLNEDKFSEILAVDTEDGVEDTILLIVAKLMSLLKGNIDSLNLKKKKKIKIGLKKLRAILFSTSKVNGKDKDGSKDGSRPDETTNATTMTVQSSST